MLPEQQPTCASLNLASLYKIELSCQRFINLGNRVIKIGAILNQNCGILTKSPSQTVYDIDRDTIFAKQIFDIVQVGRAKEDSAAAGAPRGNLL